RPPPTPPRTPYTTLFRSRRVPGREVRQGSPGHGGRVQEGPSRPEDRRPVLPPVGHEGPGLWPGLPRRGGRQARGLQGRVRRGARSEEHTSELQSRENLVC